MDSRYRFLTLGIPWAHSMPSRDATRLAEASLRRDKRNFCFQLTDKHNIFFLDSWNYSIRQKCMNLERNGGRRLRVALDSVLIRDFKCRRWLVSSISSCLGQLWGLLYLWSKCASWRQEKEKIIRENKSFLPFLTDLRHAHVQEEYLYLVCKNCELTNADLWL